MAGGLKAGDLYVVFTVDVGPFYKGVKKLVQTLERTASQVEAIGMKLGEFGTRIAAGIAGAIYAAAKVNPVMAAQVEKLKRLMLTLGNEIGSAFKPVLDEVIRFVSKLVGWFQRLSPEAKQSAAHFLAIVAAVGLAGGVIGRFAGVAAAGFKALGLVIQGVGALVTTGLIGPILIAAGVAAVLFVVAGAIREAWDENLLGIRETAAAVWKWMGDAAKSLFDGFRESTSLLMDWFGTAFKWIKDRAFEFIDKVLEGFQLLAELTHSGTAGTIRGIRDGLAGLKDDLDRPGELLAQSFKFAGVAFDFVAKGAKKNLGDLGRFAKGVIDSIIGQFSGGPLKLATEIGKAGTNKFADVKAKDYGMRPFASNAPALSMPGRDVGALKYQAKLIDAAVALERKVRDALSTVADQIGKSLINAAQSFVGKLGGVGEVATAAIQGAQDGGPWGALIAGLADLFTNFKGFTTLVNVGNGMLASLLDVLGTAFSALVNGLKPLLAAVSILIGVVLRLVTPILTTLAGVFSSLAPLIVMIATLLSGLQPVFDLLGLVLKGIVWILDKVIWGVFQVLRGVGLAILGIIWGLAQAWNGIVTAAQWLVTMVADTVKKLTAGAVDLKELRDLASSMDSAKINTDGLTGAMQYLIDLSWEEAKATADSTAATLGMTDAARDATNALTNIPTGYKVALARFNAMAGTVHTTSGIPHLAKGGIATRPTVALIGEAGPEAVVPLSKGGMGGNTYITIDQLTVVSNDPDDLLDQLERRAMRRAFVRTGNLTARRA